MHMAQCPICGSSECRIKVIPSPQCIDETALHISCDHINRVFELDRFFDLGPCEIITEDFDSYQVDSDSTEVDSDSTEEDFDSTEKQFYSYYEDKLKYLNLICFNIFNGPLSNICINSKKILYFYKESVRAESKVSSYFIDINRLMIDYPINIENKLDCILINLSKKYSYKGCYIGKTFRDCRLLFCESETPNDEIDGIFQLLLNMDYLVKKDDDNFIISIRGWQRVEELRTQAQNIKQGFLAISYQTETNDIVKTIINVIEIGCGYAARVMNKIEHNHQIVPEMFFEIGRSKFLVVDMTYPNYGAYYEAGYAEALKKEVIVCCRKKEFGSERTHFDIAQKSTVVWEDLKDLKYKLYKRIEATVGLNKKLPEGYFDEEVQPPQA